MKSMTGFGKATAQSKEFHLDVTVRAVNGRFLDVKFHGPKIYNVFESEIRRRISQSLLRGTVDVYLNRKVFNGTEQVLFNEKLAKKWLDGFNGLAKNLGLDEADGAEILLAVPDLTKIEEAHSVSKKEKTTLFNVIDEAVSACVSVRSKEGKTLDADIKKHLKGLSQNLKAIKKKQPEVQKELSKKYQARLQNFMKEESFDEQRLMQELAIQVDKSDINEELQRLEAHLAAIQKLTQSEGTIGKKMDFYAQELLREVNTIGSKSVQANITHMVVESKALIEKYREQVQNVE